MCIDLQPRSLQAQHPEGPGSQSLAASVVKPPLAICCYCCCCCCCCCRQLLLLSLIVPPSHNPQTQRNGRTSETVISGPIYTLIRNSHSLNRSLHPQTWSRILLPKQQTPVHPTKTRTSNTLIHLPQVSPKPCNPEALNPVQSYSKPSSGRQLTKNSLHGTETCGGFVWRGRLGYAKPEGKLYE